MKKRFLRELENNTTLTSEITTDLQPSDKINYLQDIHITSQLSDEPKAFHESNFSFKPSELSKDQETHITIQSSEDSNNRKKETHITRPTCRFYIKGKIKTYNNKFEKFNFYKEETLQDHKG